MEDLEKQNRRNLVAVCMKELFESKLLDKIGSGVGLPELDKWLDPEIRKYFTELDAVHRFYNPEEYDENSQLLLDDEHICEEKCGLINYCLQIMMKREAVDILNGASSLNDADTKLKDLIQKTKNTGKYIRTWYGLELPDAPESENE